MEVADLKTILSLALPVLKRLMDAGHQAYVVGGAVRNPLIGFPVVDYDITTSALPDSVLGLFSDCTVFTPGIGFGTVGVIYNGTKFEITSFRGEGGYRDCRRPQTVSFGCSLEQDVSRRDFTVNAMCFDGERLVDPCGGVRDCEDRILRAIGNADERFQEDALRILRAVRFVSEYGFTVEENTKSALFRTKSALNNISAERIREEFGKILCGENCVRALTEYAQIIAVFIPEIAPCFGFDQRTKYHAYDVYTHTLKTVAAVPPDPVLRLAAFFHDIGKPSSYFLGEDGQGHFYGHNAVSARMTDEIMQRLRYPNAVREQTVLLVAHHDEQIVFAEHPAGKRAFIAKTLRRFGEDGLRRLILLKKADNLAKGKDVADRLAALDAFWADAQAYLAEKPCFSLKNLAVDGNDVMSLGASGKRVGEVLNALLDGVISGTLTNDKACLMNAAAILHGDQSAPPNDANSEPAPQSTPKTNATTNTDINMNTDMKDQTATLARAAEILKQGGHSVVFTDGKTTIVRDGSGIRPLVELLGDSSVAGMCAADKIVGKAAAVLFVALGVAGVHALVMSRAGAEVLKANGIPFSYDDMAEYIVRRDGNGMCPMEETVAGISDVNAAVQALRDKVGRKAP